eukprot:Ihof_evm15s3 gene=Ihof_evmTU15s3
MNEPSFILHDSEILKRQEHNVIQGAFGKNESKGIWAWTLFTDRLVIYEQNVDSVDAIPTQAAEWNFSTTNHTRGLCAVEVSASSGHPSLLIAVESQPGCSTLCIFCPFNYSLVPIGEIPFSVTCMATPDRMPIGSYIDPIELLAPSVDSGHEVLIGLGTTDGSILLAGIHINSGVRLCLDLTEANHALWIDLHLENGDLPRDIETTFTGPGGCIYMFCQEWTDRAIDIDNEPSNKEATPYPSLVRYRVLVSDSHIPQPGEYSLANAVSCITMAVIKSIGDGQQPDTFDLGLAVTVQANGQPQFRCYTVNPTSTIIEDTTVIPSASPTAIKTSHHLPLSDLTMVSIGPVALTYGRNGQGKLCTFPAYIEGVHLEQRERERQRVVLVQRNNGYSGDFQVKEQKILSLSAEMRYPTRDDPVSRASFILSTVCGLAITNEMFITAPESSIHNDQLLGIYINKEANRLLFLWTNGIVPVQPVPVQDELCIGAINAATQSPSLKTVQFEREYESARDDLKNLIQSLEKEGARSELSLVAPEIQIKALARLKDNWPLLVKGRLESDLLALRTLVHAIPSTSFQRDNAACLASMINKLYGSTTNENKNINAIDILDLMPSSSLPSTTNYSKVAKSSAIGSIISAIKDILWQYPSINTVRENICEHSLLQRSIIKYAAYDVVDIDIREKVLDACQLTPGQTLIVSAYKWLDIKRGNDALYNALVDASAHFLVPSTVVLSQLHQCCEDIWIKRAANKSQESLIRYRKAGSRVNLYVTSMSPPMVTPEARLHAVMGLAAANLGNDAINMVRSFVTTQRIPQEEAAHLFQMILERVDIGQVIKMALQPGVEEQFLRKFLLDGNNGHLLALYYLQRGRLQEAERATQIYSSSQSDLQYQLETQSKGSQITHLLSRAMRTQPDLSSSRCYWPNTEPNIISPSTPSNLSKVDNDVVALLHRSILGSLDEYAEENKMDQQEVDPAVDPFNVPMDIEKNHESGTSIEIADAVLTNDNTFDQDVVMKAKASSSHLIPSTTFGTVNYSNDKAPLLSIPTQPQFSLAMDQEAPTDKLRAIQIDPSAM